MGSLAQNIFILAAILPQGRNHCIDFGSSHAATHFTGSSQMLNKTALTDGSRYFEVLSFRLFRFQIDVRQAFLSPRLLLLRIPSQQGLFISFLVRTAHLVVILLRGIQQNSGESHDTLTRTGQLPRRPDKNAVNTETSYRRN